MFNGIKSKILSLLLVGIVVISAVPIGSANKSAVQEPNQIVLLADCQTEYIIGNESFLICPANQEEPTPTETPSPTLTATETSTFTLEPSSTPTSTPTETETLTPTETPTSTPTLTQTSTLTTSGDVIAYPNAPACETHDSTKWHNLWNSALGCHYDHEHGQNPFTVEVESMFPGFDLVSLLGGVEVSHTNPSSPMENTHKHGGNKWNVQLQHPETCNGFEGAATGVNGSVIQFHGMGDYSIEAEVRMHSSVALLRQCKSSNPNDFGYIFINQLQDYGQRISPYQGTVMDYPNQPVPAYPSQRGPYLSMNCVDMVPPYSIRCRAGFQVASNNAAESVWSSKVTGAGHSDTPTLFRLLWRVRDIFKEPLINDWPINSHPHTFLWMCSSDNGNTFNPAGCEYTNTTTQVHEIAGVIPTVWDNLSGWDTNPTVGRITAEGFIDSNGIINSSCQSAGTGCYPIKLLNAFTGPYGSVLVFTGGGKGSNIVPFMPSRNIYFCNGVPCSENSNGSIPSGWVGPEN